MEAVPKRRKSIVGFVRSNKPRAWTTLSGHLQTVPACEQPQWLVSIWEAHWAWREPFRLNVERPLDPTA